MTPQELKSIISSGLLSFPLTDFDAQGDFDRAGYVRRLEWLAPYGASALFAAGGTGEFFSLTGDEYPGIIQAAVDTCRGKVPIIAGAGGPTRFAIQCAQAAEKAGAHGILLLPHYLTEAGQEGLAAHVEAVCRSVKFGVIVYNRGVCRLLPDTLAQLAERNPNLVGFKDGVGDIEAHARARQRRHRRQRRRPAAGTVLPDGPARCATCRRATRWRWWTSPRARRCCATASPSATLPRDIPPAAGCTSGCCRCPRRAAGRPADGHREARRRCRRWRATPSRATATPTARWARATSWPSRTTVQCVAGVVDFAVQRIKAELLPRTRTSTTWWRWSTATAAAWPSTRPTR
jgi:hypothetical protein